MANHKSSIKRIRSNETKRVRNRYAAVTTRNAIKNLRNASSKKEGEELYGKVQGMLDKLVKRNIIHKNKAANIKSKLSHHVAGLK